MAMPLQRNNDQERAERVERLVDELRSGRRRQQAKELMNSRAGPKRGQRSERRRGRSDVELRQHREQLEREWDERHRRRKRAKGASDVGLKHLRSRSHSH